MENKNVNEKELDNKKELSILEQLDNIVLTKPKNMDNDKTQLGLTLSNHKKANTNNEKIDNLFYGWFMQNKPSGMSNKSFLYSIIKHYITTTQKQ